MADMERTHNDYPVSTHSMEYKVQHTKSFGPIYRPWRACQIGVASVNNSEGCSFNIPCDGRGPDAYYSDYAATFKRHLSYFPHRVPDCCEAKLVRVFLDHLRSANAAENRCSIKNWRQRAPFNTYHDFQLHAAKPAAESEMGEANARHSTVPSAQESEMEEAGSDGDEIEAAAIRDSYEEAGPGMRPATKESVRGLLKVRRRSAGDGKKCVICMERMRRRSKLRRMPCSHLFHKGCVVEWLKNSPICPLCRYEMPTDTD